MTRNIYILLVFCLCSLGSLQAQLLSLGGQFKTVTGVTSGNVDIELKNADGNTISVQHIECGSPYTINGLEAGVHYSLHLSKGNTDILNGLSTLDLVLITKYILGIQELPFFSIIAADVNDDGEVSIMDLIVLRRLILAIDADFPAGFPSWTFVKEGNDNASTTYDIQLSEDVTDYNFTVIKRGDINNNHPDCQ